MTSFEQTFYNHGVESPLPPLSLHNLSRRTLPPRYPLYLPEDQTPSPVAAAPEPVPQTHEEKLRSLKLLKNKLTRKAIEASPELDEEQLVAFYQALVKAGVEGGDVGGKDLLRIGSGGVDSRKRLGKESIDGILENLEARLRDTLLDDTRMKLVVARGQEAPAHIRITERLAGAVDGPSSSRLIIGSSGKGKEKAVVRPNVLPLGLASKTEWNALFDAFVSRLSDGDSPF
jgi:hypothetical protein